MGEINAAGPLRLLLVGASGAVGRHVLQMALADVRVAQVAAPTRRALPVSAKLINPVVDFTRLPEQAPWWQADAVICTLGTTIKAAGSRAAFAAVDRDLPVLVARLAHQHGATRFALNSSVGARLGENFYLRTKAEAEAGIRSVGFAIYTIVRPSLIDTEREEPRPGERMGLVVAKTLRSLIPRRYRAVPARRIASALIEGVMRESPGEQIIESEMLQE